MKKLFITLILCFIYLNLGIVSAGYDQWDSSIYESELGAWYNFNNVGSLGENNTHVFDVSGNGNNGTVTSATFNSSGGLYRGAYEFDGIDDKINMVSSNDFNISQRNTTISFWLKERVADISAIISIFSNDETGLNPSYQITATTAQNNLGISIRNSSTSENNVVTIDKPLDTQWNYYVYIINDITKEMWAYKNGSLIDSNNYTIIGSYYDGTGDASIGRWASHGFMNSTIDEFMFFNRELSQSEISDIFLQQRDNCVLPYNNMDINENSTFCFGGQYNTTGDSERYFNDNETIQYNITSLSSKDALIYYSNNSVGISTDINSNDGTINIVVPVGNITFILDDFNLTEGITRQNSPLWFSLATTSTKHIASNLTDTINATFIFNVQEQPSSIDYVSDTGTFNYTLLPVNWTFNINTVQVTLFGIEQATGSNNLTIHYDFICTTGDRAANNLILIFFALAIASIPLIMIWNGKTFREVSIKDIMIVFIIIIVGVVMFISSAQSLGSVC